MITVHPYAKLTHKIAAAASAKAAAAAAVAKISARRATWKKKLKIFTKTWKTKKLQKTSKKSMKIDKKHRFWRSKAKTDVTIKFYAKNYPI